MNDWECPRRYQLQATDDCQQVVTISSSYQDKLRAISQYLVGRGFKGRIYDMEESQIIYRFAPTH